VSGNEIHSLDPGAIATALGFQTADTTAAREFNIRRAFEKGYSHLQAYYLSERAIQVANYSAGRTVTSTTKPKYNQTTTDDIAQIDLDLQNAFKNAPKNWRD